MDFHPVKNPYIAGLPIDPKAGSPFYGRQEIIRWIAENIQDTTQKNILVLSGERRIGKTSILLQFGEGDQAKVLRERMDHPLCPVFLDLQTFWVKDAHEFLFQLASFISRRISEHPLIRKEIPSPSEVEFEREPYAAFAHFMSYLSISLGQVILVLMIDEFDVLGYSVAKGRLEKNIFDLIRYLILNLNNVKFIVSGYFLANDRGIVFLHKTLLEVSLHKEVGFLDDADALALIKKPVEGLVVYDNDAIYELLQATNGHPFLIQFICQYLIDEMNRKKESNCISIEDVKTAVEHFVRRGSYIEYIWEGLNITERAVLSIIAERARDNTPYLSRTRIIELLRLPESEIYEALQHLSSRHLIEQFDTKLDNDQEVLYKPTIRLLQKWIQRKISFLGKDILNEVE